MKIIHEQAEILPHDEVHAASRPVVAFRKAWDSQACATESAPSKPMVARDIACGESVCSCSFLVCILGHVRAPEMARVSPRRNVPGKQLPQFHQTMMFVNKTITAPGLSKFMFAFNAKKDTQFRYSFCALTSRMPRTRSCNGHGSARVHLRKENRSLCGFRPS